MRPPKPTCVFLTILFLLHPLSSHAMETNQYHLPPTRLADIGDEVSELIENAIRSAIARVNADIEKHKVCLTRRTDRPPDCYPAEAERRRLEYLRSGDAVTYQT